MPPFLVIKRCIDQMKYSFAEEKNGHMIMEISNWVYH
jgi:hypothetical protein